MKLLLALTGIGFLLFPPLVDATNFKKLRNSVKALSVMEGEVAHNICTVNGINQSKHYWLTAAHCVSDLNTKYYVAGAEAYVVMRDTPNDLAIIRTDALTVPALKLAKKGPLMGDFIAVFGFPFGWLDPIYSPGVVMNAKMQPWPEGENGWDAYWMLISAQGAPGNSGSAVLNNKDEIVSVVQIGWGRSWSVLGSVPFDLLAQYRSYWN